MLKAKLTPYTLDFIKPAGTSRGIMLKKKSWILALSDGQNTGLGEFSIIESLSPDWSDEYENQLQHICTLINQSASIEELINQFSESSSIVFGLETAYFDLKNGGKRIIFDTPFYREQQAIPINGLIWMNDKVTMLKSIEEKLKLNFNCIKLKIGAIDYEDEMNLLQFIRNSFPKEVIEIRVDANGAFAPEYVKKVLYQLAKLDIHSIEQPIKPGQVQEMAALCENTPTPIALDEELIGIHDYHRKSELIEIIQPQYIILKPSLHGGIKGSTEWIEIADSKQVSWWMTSALESNIGLNAIAQLTSTFDNKLYQGLGTGALYHNNIESPLTVANGHIFYDSDKNWTIPEYIFS